MISMKTYAKLLGLSVILTGFVCFNVAVWGLHRHPTRPVFYVPGADPERGRVLIQKHGCGACHTVPGVRMATGQVGPPLDRLRKQMYIGGVLANTPQNLTDWIVDPKKADPRTAMPDLDISPAEARDMAALLYDL